MTNYAVGYCTNVHAGATFEQAQENLHRYACAVRAQYSPTAPMGIGLWLSAAAAHSLEGQAVDAFRGWLNDHGLVPFTMNGFPFGNFHEAVVKHKVYLPTWWQRPRLEYTQRLAQLLHALLPDGQEGSISTLPIAWGSPRPGHAELAQAAHHLLEMAAFLRDMEQRQGRLIYVCLEPEPGCFLSRHEDLLTFFRESLFAQDEPLARRYLRVCHDICHSAVMFEDQGIVLRSYQQAGILVGKVQVSAAVRVPFGELSSEARKQAWNQLKDFKEERYLHQTCRKPANAPAAFFQDLPEAMGTVSAAQPQELQDEWRVHFHVPIFLDQLGALQTSQAEILQCLPGSPGLEGVTHFEVETYAWGVLPKAESLGDLASGIAQEMRWFRQQCQSGKR